MKPPLQHYYLQTGTPFKHAHIHTEIQAYQNGAYTYTVCSNIREVFRGYNTRYTWRPMDLMGQVVAQILCP